MFTLRIKSLLLICLTINFGTVALPLKAAEKINFVYGPLKLSLSIESLKTFVETGEITGNLKDYQAFIDEKTFEQIRSFLAKSYDINQVNLYKISRTSLAQDLLQQLGKVVSTHSQRNGFYAIRGAVLTTAGKYDSWTIVDVLKEFPTPEIYISLEALLQLQDEILFYENYKEALEKAIAIQANQQAETEKNLNLEQLADLRNKGKYTFEKKTITLKRDEYRQTQDGFVNEYSFDVDFYIPNNLNQTAPVVLISHGFGSVRQNFISLAEHLASYGFIVGIPEHIGSNLAYRQELLEGNLSSALSPIEYLDRPRDMSFIIDQLEKLVAENPEWSKILNLEQIGVIGDSLGGTTVLSLAGAPLNINRLRQECQRENVIVNTALILQCQANNLPPVEYNLKDSRIKAIISAHPLSSAIFGPESMAKIDIPILITAGSNDIVTPVVTEQIYPFMWLKNEQKHLLFYQPGTHFSSSQPSAEYTADYIPEFIIGKNRDITSRYFQGIAVAFMEAYLRENKDYSPYLSASYGNFISQKDEQLNVNQIQRLDEENIISAYGNKKLPIQIIPNSIIAKTSSENQISIVEEIKETGILKLAYPRNTEPFGYLEENGDWGGFCAFYGQNLANYLEKKLDLATKLKIVVLPSNLNNRFDLVANGQAHLECGANTIVEIILRLIFLSHFL
jgi:predicted dienelactone hydrolase